MIDSDKGAKGAKAKDSVWQRRFFVLNRNKHTLEYWADNPATLDDAYSKKSGFGSLFSKKPKPKGTKNLTLLSFGEEEASELTGRPLLIVRAQVQR